MIIDKKKAKQLTKIIHNVRNANIPLNDISVGYDGGVTLQTVDDAIKGKVNANR